MIVMLRVETEHKKLMKDYKNALKMTSEFSAALNAVIKDDPEILDPVSNTEDTQTIKEKNV